jgi:branched-chain amino acid transport system substrate-binding protein
MKRLDEIKGDRVKRLKGLVRIGASIPVAAVLIAGTAAISRAASASSSSSPYRVFAIEPLSGPLATYAKAELDGLRAAASAVNSNGGVDGHKIILTSANDSFDLPTAISLVTEAAESSRPPNMVVAGVDGSETQAVMPILEQHKIVSIESAAPPNPASDPYNFESNVSAQTTDAVLSKVIQTKGYKSIGLLTPSNELGDVTATAVSADLKNEGIQVSAATYPPGATSVSSELSQLEASKPQALVVSALGADAGVVTTSRAQLNIKIPTYGDDAYSTSDVGSLVPAADLDNIFLQVPKVGVYQSSFEQTPEFATFFKALKAAIPGEPSLAIGTFASTYDSIASLAVAADQAKSISPTSITHALLNLRLNDHNNLVVSVHPLQYSTTTHAELSSTSLTEVPASDPQTDGFVGLKAGVTPNPAG